MATTSLNDTTVPPPVTNRLGQTVEETCPACDGHGEFGTRDPQITVPCHQCAGTGTSGPCVLRRCTLCGDERTTVRGAALHELCVHDGQPTMRAVLEVPDTVSAAAVGLVLPGGSGPAAGPPAAPHLTHRQDAFCPRCGGFAEHFVWCDNTARPEGGQPRERAVLCWRCCATTTWRTDGLCEQCAAKEEETTR